MASLRLGSVTVIPTGSPSSSPMAKLSASTSGRIDLAR